MLFRSVIDARNNADQLVYQTEKQLKEFQDKIDADTRAGVQAAADRLKGALKGDDISEIKSATESLQQVWHQASSKMYQQQAGQHSASQTGSQQQTQTETSGEKGGKAVDADYEVVN